MSSYLDLEGLSKFKKKIDNNYATKTWATSTFKTEAQVNSLINAAILKSNPAGTILWYSGTSAPSGYLVCNGAAYNKNTYANLFNAIGTKYGGSGDNFNVPNLGDGNGRFIRATTNGSAVGSKQDDKIRNIVGYVDVPKVNLERFENGSNYNNSRGALYGGQGDGQGNNAAWGGTRFRIYFDANRDNTTTNNPMKGHADGSDIHPYNIVLLPIIKY